MKHLVMEHKLLCPDFALRYLNTPVLCIYLLKQIRVIVPDAIQ